MTLSASTDERSARRTWRRRATVLVAAMFALLATCGDQPTQPPAMALVIDSVSPRASEAGQTVELRVVGAGFRNGAAVSFERGGTVAEAVVAEITSLVSERELVATVSIAEDAVPALYDVVVRNADGARAAAGGIFAVEEALRIVVAESGPREAGQGETREVRIFGSGFRQGDEAVWERHGDAYDGVVVQKTEFVSAEELIATISVDAEAEVATYDVVVSRPRRRGIGTELFDVLPGTGSTLEAMFRFTYDGYRSDSFHVDHGFVLDPATMDPGSWGLTYYHYENVEQFLGAHYLRDDGLLDMMWCWVPGGRVREPGTRPLECWFTPQYNFETGEYADPEDYTAWVEGDRPGDGSGTVTFTSVTPDRLEGTFSITMHVVDWHDWVGSPSIEIKDGAFSLPVVSTYWDQGGSDGNGGGGNGGGGGGGSNPPPTGDFGGSGATGINDHGEIVGWISSEPGESRAVRWVVSPDGMVTGPEELGTTEGYPQQLPVAINNAGVIVGKAVRNPQWIPSVAFIYDGAIRALRPPHDPYDPEIIIPTGINDQGVVVGRTLYIEDGGWRSRGLIWLSPLTAGPVEWLGGQVWTLRINNHGVIAGNCSNGPCWSQLQSDGTLSDPEPIDLAWAHGMNDSLDFVGWARGGFGVPVLLRNSSHIPLSGDWWHNMGMNNPSAGQPLRVIGHNGSTFGDSLKAGFWTVSTTGSVSGPTALPVPDGYVHSRVGDVNSHGWMVGTVNNGDRHDYPYANPSESRAVLWLPRETILLDGPAGPPPLDPAGEAGTRRCLPRPGGPDRCRWGSTVTMPTLRGPEP
jgi:hypothetical protein